MGYGKEYYLASWCPGIQHNTNKTLQTFLYSLVQFIKARFFGRGCSTVVELTPCNLEVVGLNPAGCWAFSSSFYFPSLVHSGVSLIRFLKEVHL